MSILCYFSILNVYAVQWYMSMVTERESYNIYNICYISDLRLELL